MRNKTTNNKTTKQQNNKQQHNKTTKQTKQQQNKTNKTTKQTDLQLTTPQHQHRYEGELGEIDGQIRDKEDKLHSLSSERLTVEHSKKVLLLLLFCLFVCLLLLICSFVVDLLLLICC